MPPATGGPVNRVTAPIMSEAAMMMSAPIASSTARRVLCGDMNTSGMSRHSTTMSATG